jgi:hypothetical protein
MYRSARRVVLLIMMLQYHFDFSIRVILIEYIYVVLL